jgi:plastocyanin
VFLSKARTWLAVLHARHDDVVSVLTREAGAPFQPGTNVVGANFDGYQQHLNYAPGTVQAQKGDKVHVLLAGGDHTVVRPCCS